MPFARNPKSVPSIPAARHQQNTNLLCLHCADKLPVNRVYVKEHSETMVVPYSTTKTGGYKPNFKTISDNAGLKANWNVAYGSPFIEDESLPSRVHLKCAEAIKRRAADIVNKKTSETFEQNSLFGYRATTNRTRHVSGEDNSDGYQCRPCDFVEGRNQQYNQMFSPEINNNNYVPRHSQDIRKRHDSGSRGPLKKPRMDDECYEKTKKLKPNQPAKQSVCGNLLPQGTGSEIFCTGITGPGRRHDCQSKKSAVSSAKTLLRRSGVEDQVIASCLNDRRTVTRQAAAKSSQRVELAQLSSSKSMTVEVNPQQQKQLQIQNAIDLAREHKLSQQQTDGVLSMYRRTQGRNSVGFTTQQLRDQLKERTEDQFKATQLWMPSKLAANEKTHRWYDRPNLRKSQVAGYEAERLVEFVHVENLPQLIQKVKTHRNYNSAIDLKFGLDHGQGSLKLTLSMGTKENHEFNSVNSMLVIAVAKIEESVESVNVMLKLGQIERVMNTYQCTFVADHKVLRMMGGLLQGRPKYPLILCTWDAYNPEAACETRTLDSVTRDLEKLTLGAEPKECHGLARRPEFLVPIYDKKIKVVPPPLHTYLGLFGKAFDDFNKSLSQKDQGRLMNEYIHAICNVAPSAYFRNSFEGNHVQKLLKNRKKLREMFNDPKYKPFHECFDSLAAVAHLSLTARSNLSDEDLLKINGAIDDLYRKWRAAGINVTPKMHDLKCNAPKFMKETKRSLGFYSEQATESSHNYYKNFINRYKNVKTEARRVAALARFNAYAYDNTRKKFTRKSKSSTNSASTSSISSTVASSSATSSSGVSSGIEINQPVIEIDESEFFEEDTCEPDTGINDYDQVQLAVEDHRQLEGSNTGGFVSTNFWPVPEKSNCFEKVMIRTEEYIDSDGNVRLSYDVEVIPCTQEEMEAEPAYCNSFKSFETNYY